MCLLIDINYFVTFETCKFTVTTTYYEYVDILLYLVYDSLD